MEEIIVRISPDGDSVTVEVNGVIGPACKLLTEELEEALGDVTNRRCKLEYSQVKTTQQQVLKAKR